MPPAAVSDKTFGREVLGSAIPVLVEFTAAHAPSNAALDDLSSDLAGKLKVVKADVDQHPTLKEEYGVRGLPTHILFKFGKPVSRRLGGLSSKAELVEWIDGALILALATRRTAAARSATEFKMANGMEVVVIPDHRAPVATHMIWYKVGSADEPKGLSGLARFLEHLTFKSLDKIAEGDFGKTILRIGGDTNASVHRDATTFWQRVPREHLNTVMRMEADRMINLRLTEDEVATEREVILEQRRTHIENEPGARLFEKMHAALYRAHPYGLPAIGLANEICRLSRDDVLRFHRLHYSPNNAILVVSGDVTPEEVKQLAAEIYGKIPINPHVGQRGRPNVLPQIAARRVALEDPRSETAKLYRSYAVPGYGTAACGEAEALDVLARILALGTTSRLYRKLVIEDKVATKTWGGYLGHVVEAGELAVSVLASNGDLGAVEAGVDEAIEDIRRNGVSQAELSCAKRSMVAGHIYNSDDQLDLSHLYGSAVAIGRTISDTEDWPAAISRVSAADVRKVARTYIIARRSVTGWLSRKLDGKNVRRPESSAVERRPL
jgi:zinc protease